jgi:hypothetical protein
MAYKTQENIYSCLLVYYKGHNSAAIKWKGFIGQVSGKKDSISMPLPQHIFVFNNPKTAAHNV